MTRIRFHQELDDLKHRILAMAGMAEQAIDLFVQAYAQRDPALCQRVLNNEGAINRAEREVDEFAIDLLAMQQPMAVDLRFIVAVIKINADLERVGDQAVNIAQRVAEVLDLPPAELPADVPLMSSIASRMIRQSLDAFVRGDADLAQNVLVMDNEVDRMKREIEQSMLSKMHDSPQFTRQALDVLLIARNLERIGDHATNIAEDVIFWVRGADGRHGKVNVTG